MTAVAEVRGHAVVALPDRPITVAEYHDHIAANRIAPGDRVELLEGWVTAKMGHGESHCAAVETAHSLLAGCVAPPWCVRSQLPIIVADDGEPEPDVSVVRGTPRDRGGRKPQARDTALVVEVSDSSLDDDRDRKQRMYARAAIPAYWIVNLAERIVEVRTMPARSAYRTRRDYRTGESVPVVLEGREVGSVPVADLLP